MQRYSHIHALTHTHTHTHTYTHTHTHMWMHECTQNNGQRWSSVQYGPFLMREVTAGQKVECCIDIFWMSSSQWVTRSKVRLDCHFYTIKPHFWFCDLPCKNYHIYVSIEPNLIFCHCYFGDHCQSIFKNVLAFKGINVAIFSDTMNVMSSCMKVLTLVSYHFQWLTII